MKIYKIIISIIILSFISAFFFYLEGFFGVLNLIVTIGIYIIIFYLFSIVWRKIRKKEIISSGIFIQNFLYYISIFIFFVGVIFSGILYYFNEINPAKMPEYTITNGKKIIKFQTMIHIGKSKFYEEVKQNIIDFKKDGGVYFYEGVEKGSEENHKKFNKALGIKFDENLYKNFSKLYGVNAQDNSIFLNLVNDKDFNVDIGIDKIMEIYKTIPNENSGSIKNPPIDANKEILKLLSDLNDRELKVLVYINQAILNFSIGNEKILEEIEKFNNEKLFKVILLERNKILAKEIINSPYDKIFITYGGLHFKGVLELLKKDDSNWKIIETKNLYPIK